VNGDQRDDRQPSGCLTVFAVGICLSLLLVAGATGGGISYLVARLAGASSIPSSIGGATTAFVIVWLTCPAGSAMMWLWLPVRGSTMNRSLVTILMAFAGPLLHATVVFAVAAVSAIGGAMLFQWFEPLTAAILIAAVAPLVGFIAGTAAGDPGYGDSNG
jgi:hypothetical protein